MDIEQLIMEVSLTPAIWDSSHTKHSDRVYISRQWQRIGDVLGVSDEAAKKKFKNLRDQFRLELKKVPDGRAGDPSLPLEEYLSSWPWFRLMFFLKDKIHRRMGNNMMRGVTIKRSNEELDQCDYEEDLHVSHDSQDHHNDKLNPHLNARLNQLKRMRESTLQADYVAIEKQRLELLKRQAEDEIDSDRMFVLSLVPALKCLQPRRAQLFRLRVQQLLYDAHYSPDFEH